MTAAQRKAVGLPMKKYMGGAQEAPSQNVVRVTRSGTLII